jgi:scyllo-inositol 2-dehydrogenase (NADP+)
MKGKTIRWGILSTGRIAKKFTEGLRVVDNCEVYAVGSRNIETARQFADENKIQRSYGSYEELFQDPDVDIIYVASPQDMHFEHTMGALENNKHVLCEKPFAMNCKEVVAMIKRAQEKKLFLMEALWSRFLPNILKVKELIDSGEIGNVQLLTSYFSIKYEGDFKHWRFNKELGGGSLLDLGIYNAFLSLFLLGKPSSIIACAGMGETGVDYTCSYTFQYEKETLAIMYSSLIAQAPVIAEIHGEKGKIFLEHLWFCPSNIRITDYNGNERRIEFDFIGNGYNYEAEEANNCIRHGKIQSDLWSWNNSIELVETMDSIRKIIGLVYPNHDLKA